jgi:hypothetical protein
MSKSKASRDSDKTAALKSKNGLNDPAATFKNPQQVVDNGMLTREQKIEVLRRWEYDIRELQVADDEGMTAPMAQPITLDSIFAALRSLGAPPDMEHSAPTKQGGS